ncbi:MAG: precorrin-6A synthase (deacetylating) [Acidimicrobiales bacterium]
MREVLVIGIGSGDPAQLTVQAIEAMGRADVFFVLDKGSATAEMVDLRRSICDRHVDGPYRMVAVADPVRDLSGPSYGDDVRSWHTQRAAVFEQLLIDELGDDGCGAFLVWGDPSLYDSTLRVLDQVVAAAGRVAFRVRSVPGISAPQALAAAHGITLHGIGQPVHITTGRRLADGWPEGVAEVVVMLDGRLAFAQLDPAGVDIWWGAYLGTPDEILIAGPLAEVSEEIVAQRAAAKERKGWMFDTYLLRRSAVD